MSSKSREGWGIVAMSLAILVALALVVFRLGDRASASVELSDPHVWVEHTVDGELLQINGTTGDITARVAVARPGDDFVAVPHGGGAAVLNRTTGAVRIVDVVSLRAGELIDLELAPDYDLATLSVLGAASEDDDIVIIGDDRLITIDPITRVLTPIVVADGLGDTVQDQDGKLLALTPLSGTVSILDPDGLVDFAVLPEPVPDAELDRRLAAVADKVYVLDPERLALNEVGVEGVLGPTACLTSATTGSLVGGSSGVSATSVPRIVVHDPSRGVLSVSEPDNASCFDIEVDVSGTDFGPPVVVDDTAYLPNYERGRIEIVDLALRRRSEGVPFASVPGRPFELEVFSNVVWANEPMGPFAAIVGPFGITPIAKADNVISSGVVADDVDDDSGAAAGESLVSSGLVAIGRSGAEVPTATDAGAPSADGPGSGSDFDDTGLTDPTAEAIDPNVLGITLDANDAARAASQETTLSASFRVSTLTPTVGQSVTFTDLSGGVPVEWTWDFDDATGATGPEVSKSWETAGTYAVELVVADSRGREATASVEISVVAATVSLPPIADFVFDRTTVERGDSVTFESRSTGDYELLSWDFGDGSQATGEIVTHQFDRVGTLTVTLTATGQAGESDASTQISVVPAVEPPIAVVSALPATVETGQFVTIQSASLNDPTSVSWDFGDGNRASGSRVQHVWQSPGTYRIRLDVANSAGGDTTFAEIRVERAVDPPKARFSQSGLEAVTGDTLRFTDLSRNEPTSVTWTFGEGNSASGSEVTHSWSEPGRYRIWLEVSNKAGSDRRSKVVTIREPIFAPDASFTASATSITLGSAIQFIDTSSNEPTDWLWDFGDGSTSTSPDATHTYGRPGSFTVQLTVSNVGGSDTQAIPIEVVAPPVASFDFDVDELKVDFFDTSTMDPASWSWDFGDGEDSDERNPRYRYDSAGSYEVTLTARNEFGSSVTTRTVTVSKPPKADFGGSADGLTVTFEDRSRRATSWIWDFGDGNSSTEENPVHTYSEEGKYKVKLTISNVAGSDSKSRRFSVSLPDVNARIDCELAGFVVLCDGSRSQNAITYEWSAPDAILISGQTEVQGIFIFLRSGRFDITLEVTGEFGQTDSSTVRSPRVDGAAVPEITRVRERSNSGGIVRLRGFADNFPVGWGWNVDGATIIAGAGTDRPTLSFDSNGDYSGTVWADNELGRSELFGFSISITDLDGDDGDDGDKGDDGD